MSLANKVVVITGAGFPNGIGAGIAQCFANEKAKVVITDLEGAPIDETVAAISGDVTGLVADASSQEAMGKAVDQIINRHDRIDVLVNNAGISDPQSLFVLQTGKTAVSSMTDNLFDAQFTANLRTTFASSLAVAPKMEDGGSIVNIASVAALGPTTGLPAYGAAKAGVVHVTKTHAIQFASRGIRVNCICPGLLWTRAWEMMTDKLKQDDPAFADKSPREIFEGIIAKNTPLGGEQTPEDIGNLAVFFASDKARTITGAVVAFDGGSSL